MNEICTVAIELALCLLGSYTCSRTQSLFDVIVQSRHHVSMGCGFVLGPNLRDQGRTYVVWYSVDFLSPIAERTVLIKVSTQFKSFVLWSLHSAKRKFKPHLIHYEDKILLCWDGHRVLSPESKRFVVWWEGRLDEQAFADTGCHRSRTSNGYATNYRFPKDSDSIPSIR